jgi:hypothetical protein
VIRLELACAVALVLAVLARSAAAEHEVFYRYTVIGYVKDAAGAPLPAQEVHLVRDKTGLSYWAKTDDTGFFVLTMRLGDESAGELLTLRLGSAALKLTARFDPANHADERGTRVDLEGTRFVDRAPSFRSTLTNFIDPPR